MSKFAFIWIKKSGILQFQPTILTSMADGQFVYYSFLGVYMSIPLKLDGTRSSTERLICHHLFDKERTVFPSLNSPATYRRDIGSRLKKLPF